MLVVSLDAIIPPPPPPTPCVITEPGLFKAADNIHVVVVVVAAYTSSYLLEKELEKVSERKLPIK